MNNNDTQGVSIRNAQSVELQHTWCIDYPSRNKRELLTYIINLLNLWRIQGCRRNREAVYIRLFDRTSIDNLFLNRHGLIYFYEVLSNLSIPFLRDLISFSLGSKERNLETSRIAALEVALIHRILSISSLSMILNSLFDLISSKRVSCVLILLSRKQKRRIMKLVLMEEN